jgi:AAA+ ATPase superfamily predicted ATPase
MFHNRELELRSLERLWAEPQAQLVIVFGRRRVGKTELLRQFGQGKRAIHFVATQAKDPLNLRAFCRLLRNEISDPLLNDDVSATWEAVLELLAVHARRDRLLVVFDEFQYLCRDRPELPSVLQKFWDATGRQTRVALVLCGSQISFMEHEILAERAPLFGRRTGQLLVQPFSYLEASRFHPAGSVEDKLAMYGVFGGLPAYLARWAPGRTLRQNVLSAILEPAAPLYDEVNFLLRTELGEPHTYASLLAAMAGGAQQASQMAAEAGLNAVSVNRYLQVLQQLRLIVRETPIWERRPARSKRGRYAIADPFLRFWFRFVLPHQSLLEVGQAERVYDTLIAPQLDAYLGLAFESMCRQFLQRAPHDPWIPCKRIGRYWGQGPEIDIVTENVDGSHYVGECKWQAKPVGEEVLVRLREASNSLPASFQRDRRYVIFSRSGFTRDLQKRADAEGVVLVPLRGLFPGTS